MKKILHYQKFTIAPHHNSFLWFPPKSASSLLSWIFTYFDFRPYCINPKTNELEFDPPITGHFGHVYNYPPDYENLDFILSLRNPYERIFSFFKMMKYSYWSIQKNQPIPTAEDFESFFYKDFLGCEEQKSRIVPIFDKKLPDFIIRRENILEDLLKLDFVKNSKLNQLGIIQDMCSRTINNSPQLPIENYLSNQIKDKIYDVFRIEFELGGYSK